MPGPGVKVLALARDDGAYVEPTLQSVRDHTYPLWDEMFYYVNRTPGKPWDPKLKELLRYILSREGQQEVVRDGK